MTTIRLGTGADAVDVQDGASVPLCNGSVSVSTRGDVRLIDGMPAVIWYENTHRQIGFVGELGLIRGGSRSVDLAALRRERAPKLPASVGGWSTELPKLGNREHGARWLCAADCGPHGSAFYWTHRPGNTPELQAAFDAAVEVWLAKWGFDGEEGAAESLVNMARALGYGKP